MFVYPGIEFYQARQAVVKYFDLFISFTIKVRLDSKGTIYHKTVSAPRTNGRQFDSWPKTFKAPNALLNTFLLL